MRVIVTLPAYNEERSIRATVLELKAVMDKSGLDYGIYVRDDGSSDGTVGVCGGLDAVVEGGGHCGLAGTFRAEVGRALELGADIIVHIDADGQYDPSAIPEMVRLVLGGCDLVIGSRFKGGVTYSGEPVRRYGNLLLSWLVRRLTGRALTDCTSGFRAFNRRVASEVVIVSRFTYTYEQVMKAAYSGFSICEIRIGARKTRKSRLFSKPAVYAAHAGYDLANILLWRFFNKYPRPKGRGIYP